MKRVSLRKQHNAKKKGFKRKETIRIKIENKQKVQGRQEIISEGLNSLQWYTAFILVSLDRILKYFHCPNFSDFETDFLRFELFELLPHIK